MAEPKTENGNNTEQKSQKSQKDILQQTEETALTELERPFKGLFLSSFSAGLDIGFSVLLMAVMLTLFKGVHSEASVHVLVAMMYPLGFIFVVLGRSELFTEHTTLAVLPVLQKLSTFPKLFRLWGTVYLANILGGTLFALILSYFANKLHELSPWAINEISDKITSYGWQATLLSAILAGWLMGLLAWLVAASRETVSQILMIIIITATIGIVGLPHCIVGNIECAAGFFNGHINFGKYFNFLWAATLGNIIGGVLFVAIIKFNHAVLSGKEQKVDLENNELETVK